MVVKISNAFQQSEWVDHFRFLNWGWRNARSKIFQCAFFWKFSKEEDACGKANGRQYLMECNFEINFNWMKFEFRMRASFLMKIVLYFFKQCMCGLLMRYMRLHFWAISSGFRICDFGLWEWKFSAFHMFVNKIQFNQKEKSLVQFLFALKIKVE